ncbi:MAG: hypothetical protein CL944_01770 [Candidatus Diapherotrites archaeon]|uniref:Uncharacterized protein n=1 Tax=Candidatus Iainarchaeum sp. TaxID=3101447 RepID=A0A2D6LPR7_9ARCH|nr:hypothetical protein [Candidatus Diapherotrites archaeon]|tara:strand:+ start:1758 stop:2063 length:306 start_codon:yes stop_codon:yes gene_type:complete
MDWKKFFEPNWNKLKYFSVLFLLTNIIMSIIIWNSLRGDPVYYYLFFSLTKPAAIILDYLILEPVLTQPKIFVYMYHTLVSLLDLAWVYIIASIIDSRLKK